MTPRSTSYLKARCIFSIRAILTKNNSRTNRMKVNANSPLFNLAEALAFSALVGLYIWRLQAPYKHSWLVFPVWLIASFLLHRDTPKTVGWRADNLWAATKQAARFFVLCILAVGVIGILLGGMH